MGLMRMLVGHRFANFNPDLVTPGDLWNKVLRARRLYEAVLPRPLQKVFAPRSASTNRVVRLGEDDFVFAPDFIQTSHPADGGIVDEDLIAVGFFIADCPILCLYSDTRLAVLRAGFDLLLPADPATPSIIEIALQYFAISTVHAWMGYGIGPCCAVSPIERLKRIATHPAIRKIPLEVFMDCARMTSEQCPYGAGHPSINMSSLAFGLLLGAGVSEKRIRIDGRCTCCLKQAGDYIFWSGTRSQRYGDISGSNLALCWLDTTVSDDWCLRPGVYSSPLAHD